MEEEKYSAAREVIAAMMRYYEDADAISSNNSRQPVSMPGCGSYTSTPPSRKRVMLTSKLGYPTYRSEEHTSELQSLMRISYAVFCLKKKTNTDRNHMHNK